MNYSMIRYILANVLCFEGVFLLLPSAIALIYGENQGFVYLAVALCSILVGLIFRAKKPKSRDFYAREGFVVVGLSWILLSLVGALPMYITSEIPRYIDALFETVSGFTTTGSSILTDVEVLSRCTAFWRSFTHWIGGMGILVFVMAILPLAGGSSMYLMRAESPGPSVGKLVPRVGRTARILYSIYIGITFLEMISLFIAGMSPYESATITFATVGTGGFGLLNSSIASYGAAVQIIIIVFMIISSINFNIYYLLLIRKPKEALKSEEMRCYLIIIFASAIMIMLNIRETFETIGEAFRASLFQVSSIISTTGFATADFNLWPTFSKILLVLLMFVGACAGSTGGGFKISRLLILLKSARAEIVSMAHPRSVRKMYLNGRRVSAEDVHRVMYYFAAYIVIMAISVLVVSLDNKDLSTSATSVIATFNNIGPGLGAVGATGNYADFNILSKIVLMFDMLIGRLEIFPMLILFMPGTWSRSTHRVESETKVIKKQESGKRKDK